MEAETKTMLRRKGKYRSDCCVMLGHKKANLWLCRMHTVQAGFLTTFIYRNIERLQRKFTFLMIQVSLEFIILMSLNHFYQNCIVWITFASLRCKQRNLFDNLSYRVKSVNHKYSGSCKHSYHYFNY